MTTLLVAGSRSLEALSLGEVEHMLSNASYVLDIKIDKVIHGAAKGIDQMGARWAEIRGYPVESFFPDWQAHGRRAGYLRNKKMVDACDVGIVIWDGVSRGTNLTIGLLGEYRRDHVVVVRNL